MYILCLSHPPFLPGVQHCRSGPRMRRYIDFLIWILERRFWNVSDWSIHIFFLIGFSLPNRIIEQLIDFAYYCDVTPGPGRGAVINAAECSVSVHSTGCNFEFSEVDHIAES